MLPAEPSGGPGGRIKSPLAIFARNGAIHGLEQATNILLGFATTVAIARAFGPEDFGAFTLAAFLLRILAGLVGYGLDILIYKTSERQDSAALRFVANVVSLRALNALGFLALFSIGTLVLMRFNDRPLPDALVLLLVMSPALTVTPLEALEFWYRGAQNAAIPAAARILSALSGFAGKLSVIALGGGLLAIGAAHAVQSAVPGLTLLTLYLLSGARLPLFPLRLGEIADIYSRSFPLFISQIGMLAAMRLDIVILSILGTERDVGLYSASLRLCEAVYVLPVVVMTAAAPFLFRLARTSPRRFIAVTHALLTVFTLTSIAVAVTIAGIAQPVVRIVFGHGYDSTAPLLAIQIFALVGISHAVATEYWWIARRRAHFCMRRTMTGALATVLFSVALVPWFGAIGAAIATVLASLSSGVLIHAFLGRSGRHLFRLQMISNFTAWSDLIPSRAKK